MYIFKRITSGPMKSNQEHCFSDRLKRNGKIPDDPFFPNFMNEIERNVSKFLMGKDMDN